MLDASALLAYLFAEQGGERVAPVIEQSCISAVNLSEVIARFVKDGHDPVAVFEQLTASQIEFVTFKSEDAAVAASLVPLTRPYGLSLADRGKNRPRGERERGKGKNIPHHISLSLVFSYRKK